MFASEPELDRSRMFRINTLGADGCAARAVPVKAASELTRNSVRVQRTAVLLELFDLFAVVRKALGAHRLAQVGAVESEILLRVDLIVDLSYRGGLLRRHVRDRYTCVVRHRRRCGSMARRARRGDRG